MDNYSLKIFKCIFLIGDSRIARTCKYNEGLTTEYHHEDPDVKFAVHIKSWMQHVPLYYGSIENSNFTLFLFLLSSWPSLS